jgi:PhoH-like ATPase
MPKNFLLDTNILIHDPYSLFEFEDNRLILLNSVQQELDRLKKQKYTAREASTILEKLIDRALGLFDFEELNGVWMEGFMDIPLENGGVISIEQEIKNESYADYHILSWAKKFNQTKAHTLGEVIVVSRDKNVRNKGKINGIKAEDFISDRVQDVYTGFREISVSQDLIDSFFATKDGVLLPEHYLSEEPFYPNQVIQLNSYENRKPALGIYKNNRLYPLYKYPETKVKPENREQQIAYSLLYDPTITNVMIAGQAGSGKTLSAINAGYHQVMKGQYQTLIITTGTETLGKEIGFLPGGEEAKIRPWLNSILDNLKLILSNKGEYLTNDQVLQRLKESIHVEIVPISYIRGRTFNNAFIILDESQNISPHEIKAVLTRVGKNSKIVVLGDPTDNQIDNVYLTSRSNGLVYALDRLKVAESTAAIYLKSNERSFASAEASRFL